MQVLAGDFQWATTATLGDAQFTWPNASDKSDSLEFLVLLGEKLTAREVTSQFPELAPLGFFLRHRKLELLLSRIATNSDNQVRVPRGLVFHIPPANVDSVFVYSWALSLLGGNANVVRISKRAGETSQYLIRTIERLLHGFPKRFRESQVFLSYEHEEGWTERFSASCDMRVLWGGDQTIGEIRKVPISPRGRDLVFPDRKSLSLISSEVWVSSTSETKLRTVQKFVQDSYWFNQAACSSPQMIVWVGQTEVTERASSEFAEIIGQIDLVRDTARVTSFLIERLSASTINSMQGKLSKFQEEQPGFRVNYPKNDHRIEGFQGTGSFEYHRIDTLFDLPKLINRKDQTCTYFGFTREEIRELALILNGQGIDRFVPFGSALDFAEVWDGEDLLLEFTRLVTIS